MTVCRAPWNPSGDKVPRRWYSHFIYLRNSRTLRAQSPHHRDTPKKGHAARVTSFLYIIITSRLPTRHRNDRLFYGYHPLCVDCGWFFPRHYQKCSKFRPYLLLLFVCCSASNLSPFTHCFPYLFPHFPHFVRKQSQDAMSILPGLYWGRNALWVGLLWLHCFSIFLPFCFWILRDCHF